ncbi:MAG: RNA polymerase sigma factor [Planctomycetota bacterium]|jgi:RNA polymerase sigma-70 factor (ECF subfamily)
MEDRLLVNRCRQGDRDALRRIYEKYRDDLLILAIALSHDVSIAEDAVHDAFVGFAKASRQLQLKRSLKAYLATSVANRVRDLMKGRQRQQVGLEQAAVTSPDMSEPSHAVSWNERLERLSSALDKLPHEQREVIVLHIQGRMGLRGIAQSLGLSVNTVKSRYRYGISKLRSILDGEAAI